MKIFKKILFLSLFATLSTITTAQSYNNAIGLRLGSSNGISFKHFTSQTDALEFIANSRWRGFQLTGLYERHTAIDQIEQFKFYYGAGAHVGIWDGYDNHPWFDRDDRDDDYVVIGIDGILGIEYAFQGVPIALSLDWKPEFNIIGYSGVWVGDAGLSVRYYW